MGKYLGAMVSGQLPRSDRTANAHRLFRDGNGPLEDFRKGCDADIDAFISAQSGFAFVSGGQLDWLDLLRPIAHAFPGFDKRNSEGEDAVGPVTRWFRTNTFYRKPTVSGGISCMGAELAESLPKIASNGLLILLGPYSFCRLVEDAHYKDEQKLAMAYVNSISMSLPKLSAKGYSAVLLTEPSIGYSISKNSFTFPEWYLAVISCLKNPKFKLGIHLPLCDASKVSAQFEKAGLDFLGIDAIYTEPKGFKFNGTIAIGIVDGARARIESAQEISESATRFLRLSGFSGDYYFATSDRLFDVPSRIALEKLRSLSSCKG